MGKGGRFACIFLPMVATIAALICIILIFLGQQNKNDSNLSNIYYFKADTRNFTGNPLNLDDPNLPSIPGVDIDDKFLKLLNAAATTNKLEDIYTVGIWSYCSGPAPADGKAYKPTFCSKRSSNFAFDPIEVWGLNGTNIQNAFPDKLEDGLKIYRSISRWLFIAHAVAFFVTLAELIVGLFAIFSRWGSCATSIVASAASLFTVAGAITASALYGTLAGTFNTVLRPYGFDASLGKNGLVVEWLAAAFSLAAGILWVISMCCCSGQSNRREKDYNQTRNKGRTGTGLGGFLNRGVSRGTTAEKTPYTYEPVSYQPAGQGSNWQPGQPVPLQDMETGRVGGQASGAYEPYRHS
ncbi:hypothetical protein P152DRAFT_7836 [Eremomyces bilateralis CBS 781.70]|uniref:Integral membrane protein n=1 Tax=Eremomyces bilateralis CBS 781.70 TaxID=1392243 RepID=A0A6G1GG65_9PEZI|nr:uncharacterized protein P152DRAFT_7836 [Eremomyces bilateralis CBS 781.70]KAF1817087.1 hypothetical protein P152DRAFT_7836 [Eremomyces bilateralis CBS 781.70]